MKVIVRDELEVINECELEISSWVKSVGVLQQQCKRLRRSLYCCEKKYKAPSLSVETLGCGSC